MSDSNSCTALISMRRAGADGARGLLRIPQSEPAGELRFADSTRPAFH